MQGAVHGNAEALLHGTAASCLQTQLGLQARELNFFDSKGPKVWCKVMV